MIVKTAHDLRGTIAEVKTESWSSLRLLHEEDGMGATMTDVILEPGLHRPWWYRNHLEAVYCLEGEGTLEDLATGTKYAIKPDTLYALDKHDRHRLEVTSRMRAVCTFVPPLRGGEIHDADGSYPRA
jgi:L-ectoine synthase